jgi:hypothetical protein
LKIAGFTKGELAALVKLFVLAELMKCVRDFRIETIRNGQRQNHSAFFSARVSALSIRIVHINGPKYGKACSHSSDKKLELLMKKLSERLPAGTLKGR